MEKLKDLGALWIKTSKKGTKFYSGKINGIEIVGFDNNRKKTEREPDIRIYESSKQGYRQNEPRQHSDSSPRERLEEESELPF